MNFEGISKTADKNMANLKTWAARDRFWSQFPYWNMPLYSQNMDFEMKTQQMSKHEQQLWSEADLFGINREIPGPIPPINFPPRLLHISIIATTIIKHSNITSTCFYFW